MKGDEEQEAAPTTAERSLLQASLYDAGDASDEETQVMIDFPMGICQGDNCMHPLAGEARGTVHYYSMRIGHGTEPGTGVVNTVLRFCSRRCKKQWMKRRKLNY